MKLKLPTVVLAAAVGAMALTAPSTPHAQTVKPIDVALQIDDGGSVRIAMSKKLRMLSQYVPAAACHLAEEVDAARSRESLEVATTEFEAILHALEHGDPERNNLAPEARRKTVAEIHKLRDAWEPLAARADAMVNGDISRENLHAMLDMDSNLRVVAETLTAEIIGQYSNPTEMVQADSFVIDIAARQQMLIQKMSKESCMLTIGEETAATHDDLEASEAMFTASLEALRHGMPSAGIRRPPTPGIAAGLDIVMEDWKEVKPLVDRIVAGEHLELDEETLKFSLLNKMMQDMGKVIDLYAGAIGA